MERLPDHAKGLAITVVGTLVLSPDGLLIRLVAVDTWTILFWRGLLIAVALTIGLAVVHRRDTFARLRAVGWAGLAVAVVFSFGSVCFIVAINITSVANTLLIASSAPLFAALSAWIFIGEGVARRTWIAILLASAGIAVILSGSLGGGTLPGDLAALGTAISIAGGFTIIRRYRHVNMIPAMAASGLIVAAVSWFRAAPLSIGGEDVLWLGLMGLVVMPAATALTTLGPRYLPAPEVSLILLLEAVLGPFWVWLVLAEQPSPHAFIGGAVVVAALAGHAISSLRRKPAKEGAAKCGAI